MKESIHGHKLMEMMMASGLVYKREALLEASAREFGEDARFHTCSDSDLTAENLIDFMLGKGKLMVTEDGLSMNANR